MCHVDDLTLGAVRNRECLFVQFTGDHCLHMTDLASYPL